MLKEMLVSLPASELKIAEFILGNPEFIVRATISELAKQSNTSSAAVIRLCKSLGLDGFQELKIRIGGDLNRPAIPENSDIEPDEAIESIIMKMTSNSMEALKETSEIINQDEIAKAARAIIAAKQIHFFGVGASNIIACDAQQKFLRIHKSTTAFTDQHLVTMLMANVTREDVVVGISFSGQTKAVSQILGLANECGATTISLTKYGSSPVADKAAIKLYTSASKEAAFRSSATSSRLAQLHVIDILFMAVATQQYEESIKYIDETKKAVDALQLRFNQKRNVEEPDNDK